MFFVNYAHRGASAYAPENTFAAFDLGIKMGAGGIETDVRRTKDGVPVLFHDATLFRITGEDIPVAEKTYPELLTLDFGGWKDASFRGEKIPSLEGFLRRYGGRGIYFDLEIKQEGVEADILPLVSRFCDIEKVCLTSFSFEALKNAKVLSPRIRTGALVSDISDPTMKKIASCGADRVCPRADVLTEAGVRLLRGAGYSVRVWGVRDEMTMRNVLSLGVDGMTVDFPDKLTQALESSFYF